MQCTPSKNSVYCSSNENAAILLNESEEKS